MARVTFVDAIDTVRGALDEVKDGQANRDMATEVRRVQREYSEREHQVQALLRLDVHGDLSGDEEG